MKKSDAEKHRRRADKVVKAHAAGMSPADIAHKLGISRGSVAGILFRHRRPKPRKVNPKVPPRYVVLRLVQPVPAPVSIAAGEPEPLGDRPGGCQWIHGEVEDRLFCGHRTDLGSSWCLYHRRRAFSTVPLRAVK